MDSAYASRCQRRPHHDPVRGAQSDQERGAGRWGERGRLSVTTNREGSGTRRGLAAISTSLCLFPKRPTTKRHSRSKLRVVSYALILNRANDISSTHCCVHSFPHSPGKSLPQFSHDDVFISRFHSSVTSGMVGNTHLKPCVLCSLCHASVLQKLANPLVPIPSRCFLVEGTWWTGEQR